MLGCKLLLGIMLVCISVSVFAGMLHDPTMPMYVSGQKIGELELNAIVYSKNRHIAIINNTIVKEGDHIGDDKVVSIDANTVQLDGPDGKIMLFLIDESVKRAVASHLK